MKIAQVNHRRKDTDQDLQVKVQRNFVNVQLLEVFGGTGKVEIYTMMQS